MMTLFTLAGSTAQAFGIIAIIAGVFFCIAAIATIRRAEKEIKNVRRFYPRTERQRFYDLQSEGAVSSPEYRDLRMKEYSLLCIIEHVDEQRSYAHTMRNVGLGLIAAAICVIILV